jgi:hypothetical protein
MARLIINPGSTSHWEQQLPPGTYSVGRTEDNDLAIEHSSISSSHCQLVVSEAHLTIKDLGSTNGTFVRGELVEQAVVHPGEKFHVGEIAIQFESEAAELAGDAVQPGAAPGAAQSQPAGPVRCGSHPRALARYACPLCGHSFCDLCVNTRTTDGVTRKYCRGCGSPCEPLEVWTAPTAPSPGFLRLLPGAFSYPLRGNGIILLISGGALFLLLGFLPFLGFLITGYLFSYAKRIIAASAEGENEPPDWPDFTNFIEDIVLPYIQMLALIVFMFGPAFLLMLFLPAHQPFRALMVIAAAAAGVFVAPMGMLSLAMFDSFSALNPLGLVWSISRIPLRYSVAAASFALVIAGYLTSQELIGAVVRIPLMPYFVSGFLNLYLFAVAMRILGLLYQTTAEELGWFNRPLG